MADRPFAEADRSFAEADKPFTTDNSQKMAKNACFGAILDDI
jgi:hypothetical protein